MRVDCTYLCSCWQKRNVPWEFPGGLVVRTPGFRCDWLVLSCSVVSDSLWSYGLWPTRLLCPWDFPGKNTRVGCHFLLQGIVPTQGSNLRPLHCRWILYRWALGEAFTAGGLGLIPGWGITQLLGHTVVCRGHFSPRDIVPGALCPGLQCGVVVLPSGHPGAVFPAHPGCHDFLLIGIPPCFPFICLILLFRDSAAR